MVAIASAAHKLAHTCTPHAHTPFGELDYQIALARTSSCPDRHSRRQHVREVSPVNSNMRTHTPISVCFHPCVRVTKEPHLVRIHFANEVVHSPSYDIRPRAICAHTHTNYVSPQRENVRACSRVGVGVSNSLAHDTLNVCPSHSAVAISSSHTATLCRDEESGMYTIIGCVQESVSACLRMCMQRCVCRLYTLTSQSRAQTIPSAKQPSPAAPG